MILPDVNVLLYAFRTDAQDHASYRRWLEDLLNGEMAYGMSPQVLAAIIRVATHPRIFVRPSRLEDVTAFASLLLEQPHCQTVQPGPRHWNIFRDVCRKSKATGNLIQDCLLYTSPSPRD